MSKTKGWTIAQALPWLLVICGIIGVIASAALTSEYIHLLKNPGYVPVCNLNPIFSCSNVTTSNQAHAFGIPNEFIGLVGFGAVTMFGLVLLAGGAVKRWLWQLVNTGLLLAVAFISWLQFQTLYRIGALCLFCMVTWVVTITAFWYVTVYNLKSGNLTGLNKYKRPADFINRHHGDILLLWFLVIIVLILKRFWYYFGSL